MVANGIFMSKLCYVITVWGGCEKNLMSALQLFQNKAMRAECKKGKRYPIKQMKELNCLSVRQLEFFHSVMQVKKVLDTKQPS